MSKPAVSLVVSTFLAVYLASAALRGEDVILLDDTVPQATATPVPAAPPLAKKTEAAHAPTPLPTPTPAKVQAAPTVQAAPASTEAPEQETYLSESQRLARRLGVLDHPIIWFVLDGGFSHALWTNDASIVNGFGLRGRVELQFLSWLSLGSYYDFNLFLASPRMVLTGPWGIMGRIFPLGQGAKGNINPFLTGGAGLNTLVGQNTPAYPGNFQAFAGVGASYPFGDNFAADVDVVYNSFFSPPSPPFQTLGAHAGLAYSFQP